MTCRSFKRVIPLWVGGELSTRRARVVEAHVASCGACQSLSDQLRADRLLLAGLADAEVQAEDLARVHGEVLRRLGAERRSARSRLRLLPLRVGWVTALAAAVLVLAVVGVSVARRVGRTPQLASTGIARPASVPGFGATPRTAETGPPIRTPEEPVVLERADRPPVPVAERAHRAGRYISRAAESSERRAHGEPLVIKLLTDDPQVVIYWLVDEKKG